MAMRLRRKDFRKGGQYALCCFVQDYLSRRWIDMTEVSRQCHPHHFRHGTCHLHTHGPCANENESEQSLNHFPVGSATCRNSLSRLKRQQNLPADSVGVIKGLKPRGDLFPFIVPEIVVSDPRREN